jgi:hypothetical protein
MTPTVNVKEPNKYVHVYIYKKISNKRVFFLKIEFKLKDNVYATEFEIVNSDDGCICVAAALSDGSAIYMYTDVSNVRKTFFNFNILCVFRIFDLIFLFI